VVMLTLAIANYVGNVINQVFDKDIDASNPTKRNRPIPSGRVSVEGAMSLAWVLTLIDVTMGFTLVGSLYGVLLAAILAFTWVYSSPPLRFRSKLFFSNLTIAFPRGGLGILTAYSSFSNPLINGYLLVLAIAFAVYVFCGNTLKDFEDREADAAHGVRNFVTVWGDKAAGLVVLLGFVLTPLILFSGYGLVYYVEWMVYRASIIMVSTLVSVVVCVFWLRQRELMGKKWDRLMWRMFYAHYVVLLFTLAL